MSNQLKKDRTLQLLYRHCSFKYQQELAYLLMDLGDDFEKLLRALNELIEVENLEQSSYNFED